MSKAIVTGGAGFIGSHLTDALVERGFSVIVIDDLSSGKKTNLETALIRPDVDFIQGTVTDLALLSRVFRGADYVFHQAAIASVVSSIKDPLACDYANITGTLNVLLAAKDNKVKKVVYASSAALYGNAPGLPKREDMLPDPRSPYAVTKLAGEYYCRVFSEVYGLPTVCLRYFNVYGPRQDRSSPYSAVIPRFINNTLEGKPPVIYGDGEQTRDFVFVKDVTEASIRAAESEAAGVYNIAGGQQISLNRLAELVCVLGGKKTQPVYENDRPGDVRHSVADISKARTFGYCPGYDLRSGLALTLKSLL